MNSSRSVVATIVGTQRPGARSQSPCDNVTLEIKLIAPIAMDPGLRFAIREGGRTVGAGVVGSISK